MDLPPNPFLDNFQIANNSQFKRAAANNRGECSKRVSLSRPSCMTDKGARVALALCGPLQGMV